MELDPEDELEEDELEEDDEWEEEELDEDEEELELGTNGHR